MKVRPFPDRRGDGSNVLYRTPRVVRARMKFFVNKRDLPIV